MARGFSLLRLSLILYYCTSQMNTMKVKLISKPEAINVQVELVCEPTYPDSGVYWIRQRNSHKLDSVLFVDALSRINPQNIQGYKASKSGNVYSLTVTSFRKQDEGIYSCAVLHNQALRFSSGLPVYLPVRTTQAPTTQQRASKPPNPNNQQITNELSKCVNATAADGLMIPCDPHIWIPLSGGCFLLLTTLAITVTVRCDPRRTRRRRCQCKRLLWSDEDQCPKRPLNGTNGKPTKPR